MKEEWLVENKKYIPTCHSERSEESLVLNGRITPLVILNDVIINGIFDLIRSRKQ
jgi:hypothetical protein